MTLNEAHYVTLISLALPGRMLYAVLTYVEG